MSYITHTSDGVGGAFAYMVASHFNSILQVVDLHREGPSWNFDKRAVVEVGADLLAIYCGRHEDDSVMQRCLQLNVHPRARKLSYFKSFRSCMSDLRTIKRKSAMEFK